MDEVKSIVLPEAKNTARSCDPFSPMKIEVNIFHYTSNVDLSRLLCIEGVYFLFCTTYPLQMLGLWRQHNMWEVYLFSRSRNTTVDTKYQTLIKYYPKWTQSWRYLKVLDSRPLLSSILHWTKSVLQTLTNWTHPVFSFKKKEM